MTLVLRTLVVLRSLRMTLTLRSDVVLRLKARMTFTLENEHR